MAKSKLYEALLGDVESIIGKNKDSVNTNEHNKIKVKRPDDIVAYWKSLTISELTNELENTEKYPDLDILKKIASTLLKNKNLKSRKGVINNIVKEVEKQNIFDVSKSDIVPPSDVSKGDIVPPSDISKSDIEHISDVSKSDIIPPSDVSKSDIIPPSDVSKSDIIPPSDVS
ncbi:MAG: hypothetical protein GY756_20390, partial [bacterium]|nr:hypothetical protein [bacterium]